MINILSQEDKTLGDRILERELKTSLLEQYEKFEISIYLFCSFRWIPSFNNPSSHEPQERIDHDKMNLTIRQFLTASSHRIFGPSADETVNRLCCLGFIAGDLEPTAWDSERLTAHLFLGGPIHERIDPNNLNEVRALKVLLDDEWGRMKWAMPGTETYLLSDQQGKEFEAPRSAHKRWGEFIHSRLDFNDLSRVIRILPDIVAKPSSNA